jgi:hypothetical protein
MKAEAEFAVMVEPAMLAINDCCRGSFGFVPDDWAGGLFPTVEDGWSGGSFALVPGDWVGGALFVGLPGGSLFPELAGSLPAAVGNDWAGGSFVIADVATTIGGFVEPAVGGGGVGPAEANVRPEVETWGGLFPLGWTLAVSAINPFPVLRGYGGS